MGLISVMQDLERAMYKKNVDKKEFVDRLGQMLEKARVLTMMTYDQQSYNDVVELVSFYIANGDKELAEPVRSFITQYLALTKGLSDEDYKYFKKLAMFYLQV
jgi:2-oxo-4-hydroxy-4-carboxy--5-ureidoimidazoline (OHCU) decarboxylase